MTDEQREAIERLERRVAVLEELVRRLFPPQPARAVSAPERPLSPAQPPRQTPTLADVTPRAPPPPAPDAPAPATDLEQWFGQRGLLVIGVVALLAAASFFLKYAFDRGWIPPLVRSLLAVAAGIGVAAWGEERIRRAMPRYGAAMIGAGGGLVFLGLWAAAGPYALIDRRIGVLLLAATTVAVTLFALHHEIEGLAIWALVGAYLAPVLLPPPVPNPEAFLGYLEVIGLGTGVLAYAMSWRRTFDLALFGYLLLAATGAAAALATPLGCWLVAAGAILALHVTHGRPWPEARAGVLLVAWAILGTSLDGLRGSEPARWLALAAGAAVFGLLWWQQLERDPFAGSARDPDATADRFLFVANPIAFLVLAYTAGLMLLEREPGALAALLGAIYLSAGWLRRAASVLMMGFALGALAMALEWPATSVAIGWTGLAVAALAADRWGGRPGGRLAAVWLATAALLWLFSVAVWSRAPHAPVFSDAWAVALYSCVAGTLLAARWWGVETPAPWKRSGAEWLWALGAAAVLAGGSIQLGVYFGRIAALAGDLALSLWWLVYAGALVSLGFRLDRKLIRSAGLAVAAGAGLKIVLYDLATLEALYRVASVFALALIALALAYVYNRKGREEEA